jgi:hypothetical protein
MAICSYRKLVTQRRILKCSFKDDKSFESEATIMKVLA